MSDGIKPVAYMFDWALERDDVSVTPPEQLALKKVIEPSNVRPLVFMLELEKLQAENNELRLMLSGAALQIQAMQLSYEALTNSKGMK
jgi:hypothetical protein